MTYLPSPTVAFGFAAPERLVLLIVVAALVVAYVIVQRLGRRYAVRFTNLDLLDTVAPERPGWRRHVPALGFVLLCSLLVVAFAHPEREEQVPREEAIVVMAIDVSLSMEADDVDPTRIEAAQEAAQSFIDNLPDDIRLGLVSFSGTTSLIPPTRDHGEIRDAIARLQLSEGTAIGEAVITGLDAIRSELDALADSSEDSSDQDDGGDGPPPAVLVVMSDGETTVGRPVEEAATAAEEMGIPVSTIAFGTEDGVIDVPLEGIVEVPVREGDLRDLADETGGTFFSAESLDELESVYADIGSAFGVDTVTRDISAWFVGAALLLAFLTGALSLLWFSRLP